MGEKIVALSIGSKYLTATVAKSSSGGPKIVASEVIESKGIKRGNICDISECTNTIRQFIDELEKSVREKISGVYIALEPNNIRIIENRGICNLERNKEIDNEHIARAYLNGKSTNIDDDECIADAIIKNFYTPESGYIDNPIGMKSKSLEVELKLIVCKKEYIGTLKKIFVDLGININGFILSIDALNKFLLQEDKLQEKNNILIDFGSERVEVGIFKKNRIEATSVIPLGARDITKDIAIVTKIDENLAEKIKRANSKKFITLRNDFAKIEIGSGKIEATLLYEVINARLEEIIGYIKKSIETSVDYDRIDNVIVIGEGIVNFEDITKFLERNFNKNIVIFTKNELNIENYSTIISNAIVKEVYDRLKLLYKKDVFSIVIYNKAKEVVSKNTIFKDKDLKENKRKLSKVLGFLGDIF